MKPLNADEKGCNPISSNCVIWQGPDIACLKLCKGDTISDVTYKIAKELCDVLEILNIDSYDLSCFNLTTCSPADFQALIQFLIGRVCKLETCTGCIPDCNGSSTTPTPTPGTSGCPDCIVSIASCFYYVNQFGDTVTTMQLSDYVHAIGNYICNNLASITTLTSAVQEQSGQIRSLQEAPPPEVILPTVTPSCVMPSVPTPMDQVLTALEQQFCALLGATGTPNNIYTNIQKQCAGLSLEATLSSGGTMGSLSGWSSTVPNMAASMGNMWLTICDMRAAIKNIQATCCPTGCDGIVINIQAIIEGTNLTIFFTGTIPVGFVSCSGTGTLFTVTDTSGGVLTFSVDVVAYMNSMTGFTVPLASTPINPSNNLTISGDVCITNPSTGATCQTCTEYVVINQSDCPEVIYTEDNDGTIDYSFNSSSGTKTYVVQLWNNLGTVLIGSQTQVITGIQAVTGTFNGLTLSAIYKLRLVITSGEAVTTCPFTTVTMPPAPCPAPELTSVVITIEGVPVAGPIIEFNSAANFKVLAGTTVTNTGVTTINGNLGLFPGTSVTGAPIVTGVSNINDATASAAQDDLVLAYNAMAAATPSVDMSGIDLGGQTLTPGIYSFTSSAAITGTLTLDGAGVYIFQITTTLTTDGGIDVVLTNGATADNVLWQVGSSATLGTGTTFNGIIAALTSINVDGGTVNGALLARNGAVVFTAGTTIN